MVFRSTSRLHVLALVTTLIVTLGFTLLLAASPAHAADSTIINLRLTIDYDQDRLRDCTSMEETYDYIDTFQVEVQTVDGVLYPVYIEYPWH